MPGILRDVASYSAGKAKDIGRLVVGSLGMFDVFYMNLDQPNCIKILVVDDHSLMRQAVTELFNGGFEDCARPPANLKLFNWQSNSLRMSL